MSENKETGRSSMSCANAELSKEIEDLKKGIEQPKEIEDLKKEIEQLKKELATSKSTEEMYMNSFLQKMNEVEALKEKVNHIKAVINLL